MESDMKRLYTLALIAGLAGCGGGAPGGDAGKAEPPTRQAAPEAPPAEAAIGPDGPADLAIPDLSNLPRGPEAVARGKAVYDAKGCGACHAFGSKLVGPDLAGLGERRSPAWIARMIRYPEQMTRRDPVARELMRTHLVQMTDQSVSDEDLPYLVAYLLAGETASR